jgi:integrase
MLQFLASSQGPLLAPDVIIIARKMWKMENIHHYANLLYGDGLWREKSQEKNRDYTDKSTRNKKGIAKNYIIPIWGEYKPDELTPKIINDPLKNLADGKGNPLGGFTKNHILFCLSAIYKYLIEEDIVTANPVTGVIRYARKQKRKRMAISTADMKKLFPEEHKELVKLYRTQRYVCAFLILKDTGLRPGELIALKWFDWYPSLKFFPITKAVEAGTRSKIKHTKTEIVRPALVSQQTADELECLFNKIKPRLDDYIFATIKDNIPYDTHRLSWNFHRAVKQAGIDHPEWVPYNLRHTFNTRALTRYPDEIVRRLLGHVTEGMTRYYRDADVDTLMDEAKTIKPYYEALDCKK